MSGPRLHHLGGVVLDLVYRVPTLPEPGGERVASAFATCAGGAFHTMACAAAHGMAVSYAGGHGRGPFGDLVRAALAAHGIAPLLPRSATLDSGTCIVIVTADGERTFVGHPGAEGTLSDADLARLDPAPDDIVVLSGYTASHPGCRDALARRLPALDPRVTLLFDPAPVVATISRPLLDAILARTDWLSANAREAAAITGHGAADAQLAALLERHCPRARGALVRAGADGCRLGTRGMTPVHLPGHPVHALDTSGAGDTHVGAFVARLAAGDAPERAARHANAAAAVAVTRPSGAAAPTPADVRALLAGHAVPAAPVASATLVTSTTASDPSPGDSR